MKKVVIVGGGSAGLLAAAYFTKRWVNVSVNLYYDTNNPNIGVGEGTTFGLIEFFLKLNLPLIFQFWYFYFWLIYFWFF